jgi:hypothetical protein
VKYVIEQRMPRNGLKGCTVGCIKGKKSEKDGKKSKKVKCRKKSKIKKIEVPAKVECSGKFEDFETYFRIK